MTAEKACWIETSTTNGDHHLTRRRDKREKQREQCMDCWIDRRDEESELLSRHQQAQKHK